LRIDAPRRVGGGCIHRCYAVRIDGAARFLKVNEASYADAFAAEADGLCALRAAGLAAPEALAHGVCGDEGFLLLEHLDLDGPVDFAALGRSLAEAHRRPGARFGWQRDNYIGATPQHNGWSDDWAAFWRERRLQPQLALAEVNGVHLETNGLDELLKGHQPQASLLHGDLWSGNVGFTPAGPVVFDPAVYYGDREADLAMSELFGGFPPAFYAAYNDAFPLDGGYVKRKHLYNLYHLLNHLNLFGGGYLGQVEATLSLLLRS
jgi:protein-ribulosamine 3-kinase